MFGLADLIVSLFLVIHCCSSQLDYCLVLLQRVDEMIKFPQIFVI